MSSAQQFYDQVHALLQQQDFTKAERACADYCAQIAEDAQAWFLFGVTRHMQGNIAQALTAFERAVELQPQYKQALNAKAMMLSLLNKPDLALKTYQELCELDVVDPQVATNIAIIYEQLKQFEIAISYYDQALRIDSKFIAALINRGSLLMSINKLDAALENNLALVKVQPDSADAYFHLAEVLLMLGRYKEVIEVCDTALALDPKHVKAHIDQGLALAALGELEAANNTFAIAQSINPEQFAAFRNKFDNNNQLSNLDTRLIYLHRLYEEQKYCDWSRREELILQFEKQVMSARGTSEEISDRNLVFFTFSLPVSSNLKFQLAKSVAKNITQNIKPIYLHTPRERQQIRIGYVSPDFREHPVAYLTQAMYSFHDRKSFRIYAYSLYQDNGETRKSIERGCDVFREVSDLTANEISRVIYQDEIDILVDLSGYYDFTRSEIFAYRPAPIQISYFGFPCTTGAEYMDYFITDKVVSPPGSEKYIAEQPVYMPSTYFMVNGQQRIDDVVFNRVEMRLPEQGFVFCCFNSPYKIDPVIFDIWMRLLKKIPQSVLWLFVGETRAQKNLIAEAQKRGVDVQRIIFASSMPHIKHLARYRLADLFLDTLWCNAHTTAADALLVGLPVLTCVGEGIPARVAASLLSAIELPELITSSHDEYEEKAFALATHPQELAALRKKLAHNRSVSALFNTELHVRELEQAYVKMMARFNRGKKPESFYVSI